MSGITPFDISQMKKIKLEEIFEAYLKEAKKIHDECEKEGVKLLLYGSVAIYDTVKSNKDAIDLMKLYRRQGVNDINMLIKKEHRDKFKEVIYSLDYFPYIHLEKTLGDIAGMFFKEEIVVKAYYMDAMEFNHLIPVDWSQKFKMSTTDLVLSKLQMHKPIDKDMADITALLLASDINEGKIISLTSDDWGLWKDVTTNLSNLRGFINRITTDEIKNKDILSNVIAKVIKLHGKIMNSPKTQNWKPQPEDSKYWRDF
ncbi:MAG: hypothetical protein QW743_08660 [Candidatus Methanomethylicia archaeon]